ncbi:MAG: cyclic nucleotide-binding domain-containing protein [Verrucomicrobiota bacterium]
MPSLQMSKLFTELTPTQLAQLESHSRALSFPPKTVIFNEGDPGDGLYLVQEGSVNISALLSGNERRTLTRVTAGDFFGEMAVLDEAPRSATATTESDVQCVFIPRAALIQAIEGCPRLAISLVREFSWKLRDFNQQYIREVLQVERLTLVGRFARTIVHDFKNPLNIIGLAADLIDMEKASPEMRRTASGRIRKQVERLTNMINELLEFTRGSQQVMHPPIDYRQYLERLMEEYRSDLAERKIQLTLELPPEGTMVYADPKRLIHVFSNLIHNAQDAMLEGGQIHLRCFAKENELFTEISDTGAGIAPEIKDRLFDAFASFGKAKGTGLGLSICKRIIEDHRGTITATNRAPIDGTTEIHGALFTFSLPLQESTPEPAHSAK